MAPDAKDPAVCPVDHSARAAWMEKARESRESQQSQSTPESISSTSGVKSVKTRPLSLDRETSSIPRTDSKVPTTTPNPSSLHTSAENEQPSQSSNWIYPSEKMFFEAMKRKKHSPVATDMASIVPIHNAVNERAWKEIKDWESRFTWSRDANKGCGGPRLHSFSGDSKKLSPKARWNSLLGYQEPFDRHDWVIERCPGRPNVEYVIDFYSGRNNANGKGLNFYLDVRPKLNTWEGWKMRLAGVFGL